MRKLPVTRRRPWSRLALAGLLGLALAAQASAQNRDPLGEHLVPPELIMQMQRELGLTPEQRERIKEAVSSAQRNFTSLQWDLQAQMEELSATLEGPEVDSELALEDLDRLLAIESRIKRTHLTMLLELRGVLTPEQFQRALRSARQRREAQTPQGASRRGP